ncbi:MAG: FAD-dependent oxidoreductase [Methylacidiphilales bacterium]|nr:FAD-dependent oxidoreductase [Candidatus Methylacidiphilales bacterium]
MKVAIIGSGISGLMLAHLLHKDHSITIYEKENRIGGHAHTQDVTVNGNTVSVDTGFIVYNQTTYPLFTALLSNLQVPSAKSTMSFSVFSRKENFEYCGSNLATLFSQKKNLLNKEFLCMLYEIIKFNRQSKRLVSTHADLPLQDFLREYRYSDYFISKYLFPMCSAIWSTDLATIGTYSTSFVVNFFHNHGLLSLHSRPQWLTIPNGSKNYINTLIKPFESSFRLSSHITTIQRDDGGVIINTNDGANRYDYLFFACPSDQALALLASPTTREIEILSAIKFQTNTATLHTDKNLMPVNKNNWAAWNYNIDSARQVSVTYHMNQLQPLATTQPLFVSLNCSNVIKPELIISTTQYTHPLLTLDAMHAVSRRDEISGPNRTYYAGAYWGNGFHEDGVRSAYQAVNSFTRSK